MEFGQLHHVEYYVNDLKTTIDFWGWFLQEMGYTEFQRWPSGISWAHRNQTYIVFVEVEPEFRSFVNRRNAAGLNHICFQGKSKEHLTLLADGLGSHGARLLMSADDRICFEETNGFAVEVFL